MRQLGVDVYRRSRGRRWPLVLWTAVILLAVVPWTSYQDHSHWARVQWIPFVTPPIKLRDLVANVLLYVPFGYWSMRLGARPRAWRGLVLAAVLSLGTEFTQVYSHGRFPSLTDVVCNVTGAWLGTRRLRPASEPSSEMAAERPR
jgi:glycopeptide antibiotics resistance protein